MNLHLQLPRSRSRSGFALIMVMAVMLVCLVVLAATVNRTSTVSVLNDRNNEYTATMYAAEAATEKVVGRLQTDFVINNLMYISNSLDTYRGMVPTSSEDSYWGNYTFTDAQNHSGKTYVSCIGSTGWGALGSQYAGLYGYTNLWRVLSNAKKSNGRWQITSAVQQDIQLNAIPVFQFAIFYDGLLEFTWAAPMTVNGRVHANSNIYVGTAWTNVFNSTVTMSGNLQSPAWDGHGTNEYTVKPTFKGTPGYSTNYQTLNLPVGGDGINPHEIINMPPPGGDTNTATAQQRYYNKADITILVSNATVTTRIQYATNDPSPVFITANYNATNFYYTNYTAIASNFPFLSLTNGANLTTSPTNQLTFYDDRENKTAFVTQIDMGKLKTWITTNAAINTKFTAGSLLYPNILYVADNRTSFNSSTGFAAVRLMNGSIIPPNPTTTGAPTGFTVATPNPLYVWGNYNVPTATNWYPASLVSDALTILSPKWVDSKSASSLSQRLATNTTVNAAIITGVVDSTGSGTNTFSGGVHNLPRLLEDWSNSTAQKTLTLNTSIVNLYDSQRVTAQFQNPGQYYYAPSRNYLFDTNFMDISKLPPGSPMLAVMQRYKWSVAPAGNVAYGGP